MINRQLLTAKGTIDAVLALENSDEALSVADVSDEMDVADGTARDRLDELADIGLVTEDADIVEGRPVRVFSATDTGEALADSLRTILQEEADDVEELEAPESE